MGLTPPHVRGLPGSESEVVALVVLCVMAALAAWLERRFPAPPPFRSRQRGRILAVRALAAVLLAVGALVVMEGALRLDEVIHHPAWRADPDMYWTLAPNLHDQPVGNAFGTQTLVSTNALGLRERDVPYLKAPGELRLLCLGDSWTFGQGVTVRQTFERRLEDMLQRRLPDRKVTVINAGEPGFSYYQGYALVKQLLPLYHPDVVLMCGFNEVGNRQIPQMEDSLPGDPLALRVQHLLHHSRVYMLLRKEVERFEPRPMAAQAAERSPQANRQPQPPPPPPGPGRPGGPGPDQDRFLSVAASLRYARAIALAAREAGARCVFFNHAFTPIGNLDRLVPYLSVRDDPVLERLYEPGVVTATLCPVQTEAQHEYYMQQPDVVHPNVMGHEAMARAVFQLLEASGFLPR